ncbi:ParB/Srx family N-terminal domain-containing protein [Paraburkholderia caribensis]|nr:ParB/Srx family N-terminal domain-containing protein [Paraburkholderia caribensis]
MHKEHRRPSDYVGARGGQQRRANGLLTDIRRCVSRIRRQIAKRNAQLCRISELQLKYPDVSSVCFTRLARRQGGLSFCAEFWLTMENNRWTYPYDAQGRRVPFPKMFRQVWELIDDEYRSLSATVRDAGGYKKTNVPLAEFRWADFFRQMLGSPNSNAEYKALVDEAVKLAQSDTAIGLPGYVGVPAKLK